VRKPPQWFNVTIDRRVISKFLHVCEVPYQVQHNLQQPFVLTPVMKNIFLWWWASTISSFNQAIARM